VASPPLTVIVGAGISGLACAFALQQSGHNVLVLEAASRPGGVIQTVQENGYLFELGPQSFSSTPALYQLCDDLGLSQEIVEAPHGAPRCVLIDGKLTPVPMSPGSFFSSNLLGWGTKFSILSEVLRTTHTPEPDESIADFTRRKFSAQLLDRLVAPFVSGIYAGDPEQISLRAAFPKLYEAEKSSGSIVRGMFRSAKTPPKTGSGPQRRSSLISFKSGNEALIRALADNLGPALHCNASVAQIARSPSGFTLKTQSSAGAADITCDRIVIAVPSTVASTLLADFAAEASPPLQQITYAPVAVVSLAYRRDQIRASLSGFGFLVPRSAGIRSLGTVWNSSLFSGRAPDDQVLLTSFVGGATDPGAPSLSAADLSNLVHHELAPILKIAGEPSTTRVTCYARAIPQYNLGHTSRLQAAQQSLSAIPNLWVIGNYWKGPAVGSCVENSQTVAEQIRIS